MARGRIKRDPAPVVCGNHLSCLYSRCQVSQLARRIQSEGRICLALGGDHSVTIGTVDATVNAHEDVAVIWVDAHADLNTPATSPSGSAHGMPVALLAKDLADYWPYLPGMDWQVPK
ncbi:hypothetical protein FOCC_FOCC017388 [Frankliniella occidentalis]|uniref:Arginase, hepatic-like n=1 Tax=Frankliniella occidentalis TaxID=133901 RepID=A0A9C6XVH6_FRAOC|nr:arginase, hepatic-like [Frankliniella occidentalis]KAE8737153.1 hypothetical protein FOCC_FOCC017388 [Frankliniella occidentalis]